MKEKYTDNHGKGKIIDIINDNEKLKEKRGLSQGKSKILCVTNDKTEGKTHKE